MATYKAQINEMEFEAPLLDDPAHEEIESVLFEGETVGRKELALVQLKALMAASGLFDGVPLDKSPVKVGSHSLVYARAGKYEAELVVFDKR